jgi:glycosyltransferase involved in cell wall biosynthesis
MPASHIDLQLPFLSTFLYGGASFINTRQFNEHGSFNDEMLVGFEDLEFSLRLYQRGIKIATAPVFSLIHAHDTAISEEDIEYEKIRYPKDSLKASAEYIYQKYGLRVWMPWVEKWIDNMREKVGVESQAASTAILERQQMKFEDEKSSLSSDKRKIAFIIDSPNDNFVEFSVPLFKYLNIFYDLDLYYASQYDNIAVLLQHVSSYNLIHIINYRTLFSLFSDQVYSFFQQRNWNFTDFLEDFVSRLILTTQISNQSIPDSIEGLDWHVLFSVVSASYAVTSQNMQKRIKDSEIYPYPDAVLENVVDVDYFSPLHLERLVDTNRPLIIGWIVDEEYASYSNMELDCLIDKLNRGGVSVKGHVLECDNSCLSLHNLRDFFNTIDIYLHLGKYEQRALAAMACGLPIVVSSSEIDPTLFGPLQGQFLVVDQNPYLIQRLISQLANKAETRVALSQENLERVDRRDLSTQVSNWHLFFEQILHSVDTPERAASLELRRTVLRQQANICQQHFQLSSLSDQLDSLDTQLQEARAAHQRTLVELQNTVNAYEVELQNKVNAYETVSNELLAIKWSRTYRVMVWLRQSPPGRLLASMARYTLRLVHVFRK